MNGVSSDVRHWLLCLSLFVCLWERRQGLSTFLRAFSSYTVFECREGMQHGGGAWTRIDNPNQDTRSGVKIGGYPGVYEPPLRVQTTLLGHWGLLLNEFN